MTGPYAEILARDADANEHVLQVTEDATGMLITVSDDAMVRIMPIMTALELAWMIIQAATRLRRVEAGTAGPFSASY